MIISYIMSSSRQRQFRNQIPGIQSNVARRDSYLMTMSHDNNHNHNTILTRWNDTSISNSWPFSIPRMESYYFEWDNNRNQWYQHSSTKHRITINPNFHVRRRFLKAITVKIHGSYTQCTAIKKYRLGTTSQRKQLQSFYTRTENFIRFLKERDLDVTLRSYDEPTQTLIAIHYLIELADKMTYKNTRVRKSTLESYMKEMATYAQILQNAGRDIRREPVYDVDPCKWLPYPMIKFNLSSNTPMARKSKPEGSSHILDDKNGYKTKGKTCIKITSKLLQPTGLTSFKGKDTE